MKDHRVLDAAADRPDLTKKGLLKIHDVTYSDSGVYSCIGNVFVCVCVCVCVCVSTSIFVRRCAVFVEPAGRRSSFVLFFFSVGPAWPSPLLTPEKHGHTHKKKQK